MPRALLFILIFTLSTLGVPGLRAADGPNEYELKAVMLFNLARFVEWPAKAFADSNSPIVIGILGRSPFGDILDKAVQGETVNGRHLVVEHYDGPQELKTCHILFIGSNEKSRLPQILSRLKGQPVLSVSEIDGFTKIPGGMVRFYTNDEKKIRLRLNLESARSEGLGISSKLIQVAELDKVSFLWPGVPQMPEIGLAACFAPNSSLPIAR